MKTSLASRSVRMPYGPFKEMRIGTVASKREGLANLLAY
jgi:hypothetical protein